VPAPAGGGRLGNAATRAQNAAIAADLKDKGYTIIGGGGEKPEEYIRGPGPHGLGGTFVDVTAVNKETGAVTRVQTIDTLADGSPTPREAAAAARIRAKYPNDTLILIPKRRTP
jgi:filamentous hemagglutinin